MEEEIWKDIPGFEGYQISNLGRVRSCRLTKGKENSAEFIWREVKTYSRAANLKYNHWRPVVVIRKVNERKCYTFQVGRLMWEVFKGPIPDGMMLDHIDRNPFNNRFDNLRLATMSQNQANRKKRNTSRSKFKGITYDTRSEKWIAQIKTKGKNTVLGRFDTEKEAAEVYQKAAKELFGEFAFNEIIN